VRGAGAAILLATQLVGAPAMAAPDHRTRALVQAGAAAIDVTLDGAGPAIVLLPSLARDSDDFDGLADDLAAAGFRVLRPQPRGVARSTGPLANLTLHDFAGDIAAVIRAHGAGRAIVVGHAYGNWVARMTAVDHPDLVRGVVIAAAAAKSYPAALSADVTAAGDPGRPEAERLAALRRAFFAPGHDPAVWLTGWHPEIRDSQRAAAAATPQAAWWSAGQAPLLELQAALDPFKPPEKRQEMTDEFGARVTVVVIDDASHALIPEQPAAVARAIAAWARGLR